VSTERRFSQLHPDLKREELLRILRVTSLGVNVEIYQRAKASVTGCLHDVGERAAVVAVNPLTDEERFEVIEFSDMTQARWIHEHKEELPLPDGKTIREALVEALEAVRGEIGTESLQVVDVALARVGK
jgi:hypothetical protein